MTYQQIFDVEMPVGDVPIGSLFKVKNPVIQGCDCIMKMVEYDDGMCTVQAYKYCVECSMTYNTRALQQHLYANLRSSESMVYIVAPPVHER